MWESNGLVGTVCQKLRKTVTLADGSERLAIVAAINSVWGEESEFAIGMAKLWSQWKIVIEAVRCKDVEKARVFELDKEVSKFLLLWVKNMHPRSFTKFYLHTLVHHVPSIQRYLVEEFDLCLGMFANEGFEKRHEFGREAYKKCAAFISQRSLDVSIPW